MKRQAYEAICAHLDLIETTVLRVRTLLRVLVPDNQTELFKETTDGHHIPVTDEGTTRHASE
jgi:hypothetical protein